MHLLAALLPLLSLTFASPTPDSLSFPPPPSLFTVAAFQQPYPPGSNLSGSLGISGVPLVAIGGNFFINPSAPSSEQNTVLWVEIWGQAWLDSAAKQQIYLDTRTGALSYLTSATTPPNTFAPGAIVTNFLHLGEGTSVSTPIGGGFATVGPGTFDWLGSPNDSWFFCPRPGKGYQVLKQVGGLEDWNACLGGNYLAALDYSGPSPAVGSYQ